MKWAGGQVGFSQNRQNQERLVAQPRLQAEALVGPSENRLDITLGGRRDYVVGHEINRRPCDARPLRRRGGRSG